MMRKHESMRSVERALGFQSFEVIFYLLTLFAEIFTATVSNKKLLQNLKTLKPKQKKCSVQWALRLVPKFAKCKIHYVNFGTNF